MIINADDRNFTTVEEIADDMITTLVSWSDDKLTEALDNLSLFINDWYYDYELTDEEFNEIEETVTYYLSDEEDGAADEDEDNEVDTDYEEKLSIAKILVESPAWNGISDADELARYSTLEELNDCYNELDRAEAEYYDDMYGNESEIRTLVRLSGMSQAEFADYFKIPKRTIENWCTSKREPPEYVINLIEYKLKKEGIILSNAEDE